MEHRVTRDIVGMDALDFNENELEALELFKERLGDFLTDELDSYQRHDANLMRWLRARELDLEKAEAMLKESMTWRRESDIDKILSWQRPEFMEKDYKIMVPGGDKDGCIISIVPFGKWDIRGAVEAGHRDDFIKYANQILEQGFIFMRKESSEKKIHNQFIIIFDWEGFSLNQVMSRETVETLMECLRLFEVNYPETLKEAYVINAPAIFEMVYNLLKPFVTARTLEKLKIFGTSTEQWRANLLQNIDPSELPSQYGGSNTACQYYDFKDGIERPPKAADIPRVYFKTVTVAAGAKLVVDRQLAAGTKLTWNFKSDGYDIGFILCYEDTELLSCARVDSHLHMQKGLYNCDKSGIYKLCFDNTFSKFRSKTVSYAIKEDAPPTSDGFSEKIDQLG